MFKRIYFMALVLLLSAQMLNAVQVKNKVEFDLKAGTNDFFIGDYAGSNKHSFNDPAAEMGLHYWFNNHFSGGLVYNFSRLGIENGDPSTVATSMDLNTISLMMKYRVFADQNFNITFNLGAGYLWYDQSISKTTDPEFAPGNYDRKELAVPLGVNLSYFFNQYAAINFQAIAFTTFTDHLDAYTINNSDFQDDYDVYLNLLGGFSFYLNTETDSDKDGIVDSKDKCPTEAEDYDGFKDSDGCPDNDNDNDGVSDIKDRCPTVAEDKDGYEDDDGCPDTDNDRDGILDTKDKCPNEAEDKDGFEDEDGCPDLDNDNDGVLDVNDKCPQLAEDKDGFEDADGCPDTDNDLDGILDINDKCPNEAETMNSFKDDDGCPDTIIKENETITLFNILFETNKATLLPESYPEIEKCKIIFDDNPFMVVQIEGHTDNVGQKAYNKTLSLKRAQAVRTYLIDKVKISAKRLRAVGFGMEKPIDTNETPEGRSRNRRIEFKILSNKVELK